MSQSRIRETLPELLRFGVVGLSLNAGGYLLYLLLALWMAPTLAVTVLYPFALVASYFAHRHWTYRSSVRGSEPLVRYAVIFVAGYLTNIAILHVATTQFGLPHQWVQAACIFIVAAQSFVLGKLWVFNDASGSSPS